MGEIVIETQGLTKRYGRHTAVDSLNLTVNKGEVFGLLGPNGSGKTTTILMLLGLTEPTAGHVQVLGLDPVRQPLSVKSRVGYLPDRIGFYENLSAKENLIYTAKLNGLSGEKAYQRIDEVLRQMGLFEVINRPVKTFSHGMRQRLGVAEVLLKQPEIIIMDEPTLGLDPEAARLFINIILDLKKAGITILLSSHLLHQVQEVCDRVGLFSRGRMMLEGRVDDLIQQVLGGAYRIRVQAENTAQPLEDLLKSLPGVVNVRPENASWYILEATSDLRAEIASKLISAGGRLMALAIEQPTLDEVYTRHFKEADYAATA
jgi:ABC-2 type transport system ATP-binding protein